MAASKKRAQGSAPSGRTTSRARKAAKPPATGKKDVANKRKSATPRQDTVESVPAARDHESAEEIPTIDVTALDMVVAASAPIAELVMLGSTVDQLDQEDLLLEVRTDSGEAETFTVSADLVTYLKALRAQFDEVVLPGVLERVVKGAAPIAPEELARRMLAVAPAPSPRNKMAEQVGPEYYDTNGVKTVLASPGAEPVSKQAVEHRRKRHTILALPTSDRRWIYPTWQFRDNDVLPGLADVLATFYPQPGWAHASDSESGSPGVVTMARSRTREEPFSRWSVATWMTTPLRDLDGLSVADWLLYDRDRDRVMQLARRTAAAWAA